MKKLSATLCSVALMAAFCALPGIKCFAADETAPQTLITGKISGTWIKEHGRDASASDTNGSKTDDSMGAGNGNSGQNRNGAGIDGSNSSDSKGKKTDAMDGSGENDPDKKEHADADQAKEDNADGSNGTGSSAGNGKQDKLPQTGTPEPGLYRLIGSGMMAVSLIMLLAVVAKGGHHGRWRRRKFRLLGNF